MKLNKEQILQLASLSRLALDEKQVTKLEVDLANLMQMVEKIQSADTGKESGMVHISDKSQPLRKDTAVTLDKNLAEGAKESGDGFVIVPKVIG